ncbi:hypothetical protein EJ02DRAFT_461660 [Clathrospora elynae]|uniref:Uncharacterized protein n=1 Tax=Clathrospora elynae TaxID=706981 RepID=A0A6A5T4G0_9PLEO|nr:hypothetical protein EJ02DRAFT_461660 [Clathrospora elynae]
MTLLTPSSFSSSHTNQKYARDVARSKAFSRMVPGREDDCIQRAKRHSDIQDAMKSASNSHPFVYKRAVAVLMYFEDDDIGCTDLEEELAATFHNLFNFAVRKLTYGNNKDIRTELIRVLLDLVKKNYTYKGSRVILVYSGGSITKASNSGAYGSNGKFRTKTMGWTAATSLLDNFGCDVLHLLDCLCAEEAVNGKAEVVAAWSAYEQAAAATSSADTGTSETNVSEKRQRLSKTTGYLGQPIQSISDDSYGEHAPPLSQPTRGVSRERSSKSCAVPHLYLKPWRPFMRR